MSGHRCTRFGELYAELERVKADIADPATNLAELLIKKADRQRIARLIITHLKRCKECA